MKLYYQLPAELRSIPASMRGYYLRGWRYGSETEQLIQETIDREKWTGDQWKTYLENRQAYILHRAVTRVPYYRDQWAMRRRLGDNAAIDILENWPLLSKQEVRKNPKQFIADDCSTSKMFVDRTGGTTGTPLRIYESRSTVQHWYAICEARIRRWHDLSIHNRWAILGGQLIIPVDQTNPPYWVRNLGLNQLYLSSYHISPKTIHNYVNILDEFKPTHLVVYPSSAAELSRLVLEAGLRIYRPRVIFSNAEPLLPKQRLIIGQAFGCPVRNTYGMGELVLGASECGNGNMHSWPEVGIMERGKIEDPTSNVHPLISTGLINQDMILIRYQVGDMVTNSNPGYCSCGRTLPLQTEIVGRTSDMLVSTDGRKFFWFNPIFYDLPIYESQIIQDDLHHIRVIYVSDPGFTKDHRDLIQLRLGLRLGKVDILFEEVKSIPREANGKFRAVISHLL